MAKSVGGTTPSAMKNMEVNVGIAAVRVGNAIASAITNTLQAYWRVIRWLGTSIILGGLAISVLISFATTGSPGLTDPSSWPIVQLFLGYPEISYSILGAATFFALSGMLAQRLSPAKPTAIESEQYVLEEIRALDSMQFVPGYQSAYLFRNNGKLDLDARSALRDAAVRRRRTQNNPSESYLGICIFGRPMEGKTRFAWEAIRSVLPGWTLLRWPYNSSEYGLRRQVLRRRRIVLWLDDLQKYDAEALRELKDLPRRLVQAHARFVIVATCRDAQDETRVRQDLVSLLDQLCEFRLVDISQEEERQLATALTRAGVSIEEASFDGSPGSLILGLADMRMAYTQLRDDAKRMLRALKLLRSIGIYEYPALHVLAAAGAQGLFDSVWVEARDALVAERFLRLGTRDEDGRPSLVPIADVYIDSVVFDFPVEGASLEELWPSLRRQFEERHDGSGLLALGNAYLSRQMLVDPSETPDRGKDLGLAHECYDSGLRLVTSSSDPGSWARLQANMGSVIVEETQDEEPQKHARLLQVAIKHFQAALTVSEESYPTSERIETHGKLAAAYDVWRRLTQSPDASAERLKASLKEQVTTLRLLDREREPLRWAEAQRSVGAAYRDLAELEPGSRAAHLDAAKKAYSQALTVFTRAKYPVKWAELQMLVGNANWRRAEGARQPTRDRVLADAGTAYSNVLAYYSVSNAPIEWATAQFELARLYLLRAKYHQDVSRAAYRADVQKGKTCIDAAFMILNQEAFPTIWTEAQRISDELDAKLRGLSVPVNGATRQSA